MVSNRPKRILLKLSGELLSSPTSSIDPFVCKKVAKAISLLTKKQYEVAVVIGGGNIYRGASLFSAELPRSAADQIGMIATLMNGIALREALDFVDCPAELLSAFECPSVAELFHWKKACELLKNQKVAIFVGGTGNPYFTTDTAAALRASEINAHLLLKATKVDGVFSKDPLAFNDAVFYQSITHSEVLAQKLMVMDATAIALCRSNHLDVRVFNMKYLFDDAFGEMIEKNSLGTLIHE